MPQNLQNNPWFQLVLVLLLAGAAVYAGKTVWPNTIEIETEIASLQATITDLQAQVDEGRKLEAKLPELEREIKSKQAELENLKKIIPSDREAQDLIRKLERMATETNIQVRSFQSQPTIAREFYFEWPISISASGSYHNLGLFFSKISGYARLINVQSVRLSATNERSLGQTIQAGFTALTYVYREEAGK